MAAPPSIPYGVMLAIHDKSPTEIDLCKPLNTYITAIYKTLPPSSSSNFSSDLDRITDLRCSLTQVSTPSLPARRDVLLSYFPALTAISERFPISKDRSHVNTLVFTWYDAFKPGKRASQHNVHFEMAAVVFNVGAVYSQIGLGEDRCEGDGLKLACNAFMCAAGAFAYLRDNESVKAGLGGGVTVDIGVESAGMLERLMLAQAQECFFEKAIKDGKPPSLCSKIARQVSIYYEEAYSALIAPPLNQHFDRTWTAHLQLKTAQFNAEACYRTSIDLHEKENIGDEIARLRIGINFLTGVRRSSRGASQSLIDVVSSLENTLSRNLERAVKENERVYLMRVRELDSFEPLPAAPLVKPTPFKEMLNLSTPSFFASIPPENIADDLSKYIEMVDEIGTSQAEKLQEVSEVVAVKLKEMNLSDSIESLEVSYSIPLELKKDMEAVQVIGGPSGFEAELQQLKDLRRIDLELLETTKQMLQKEENEDIDFRTKFGTQWIRPQSLTLTKNLHEKLNRFTANLDQAADSDAHISASIKDNFSSLAILECKPIESVLPAMPMASSNGNDTIVRALKQSLSQLNTLGAQKEEFKNMFDKIKNEDDILPKLMENAGSYEDIFSIELTKYDHICENVLQNVKTQEDLLLQIQALKSDFEDYKVSIEKRCYEVATAMVKFWEIKENINQGLSFYIALQDAIKNSKQTCSDFVMSRNIESEGMLEGLHKNMGGLHISSNRRQTGRRNR